MHLDEVSNQINKLIVGHPTNKSKFREHIDKLIQEAKKYRQYLSDEVEKMRRCLKGHYDAAVLLASKNGSTD